jgi:hypothetical protein
MPGLLVSNQNHLTERTRNHRCDAEPEGPLGAVILRADQFMEIVGPIHTGFGVLADRFGQFSR